MPSRVPSTYGEDIWTDHLPVCRQSGVGFSTNITYKHTGQPTNEHAFEDEALRIEHESGVFLYGVFDGHNGKAVAEYAAQKMAAELLFGQLDGKNKDDEVKEVLRQAFVAVERGYLDSIGHLLAKRTSLLSDIQGTNISEASQKYPEVVKEIESVTNEIMAGTTGVIALIKDNRLYVASVGDCRALLCKTGPQGELRLIPLTVPHDISNHDEVLRLSQLGLSESSIRLFGHPTRCLGDFPRKGGYKDSDVLSSATEEPVIADPELQGGIALDDSCQFLILMSSGVYCSLEDATGWEQTNRAIAAIVASEFSQQTSLNAVAQSVLDRISRDHNDTFLKMDDRSFLCKQREDMTLLIRNFNYPLPNAGMSTNELYLSPQQSVSGGLDTLSTFNEETNASSQWSTESPPPRQVTLPLDDNGRIAPYVDFTEFYENIKKLEMEKADRTS